MNERWRVQYSEKADRRGSFPWHIEPVGRDHPDNEWANSWHTVFVGNVEQAFEKVDELIAQWEPLQVEKPVTNQPANGNHKAREKGKMTATLRYEIMQRDGFKCCLCGRAIDDGIKLHVDHIIPLSKGGYTRMDNLRTLCADCNQGKGARVPAPNNGVQPTAEAARCEGLAAESEDVCQPAAADA